MSRLITFPSIEQFRNVIHVVKHKATYTGKDAEGNVTYDETLPKPILKFCGTVKLHGSNAGIVRENGEIWAQSKERVLTPADDNYGFAMYVHGHKSEFEEMFNRVDAPVVAIFGEWCGQGIQRGMAISKLPKMFVVFAIATVDGTTKTWLPKEEVVRICSGYRCIYDFPHWIQNIDFNKPEEVQTILTDMTLAVEEQCPAGKTMGQEGIGEGIVWKCITLGYDDSGYWFKVKGLKHEGVKKIKAHVPVDVERINNIKELVHRLVPEWRLQQFCPKEKDMKHMGVFIRTVMEDVLKEEMDTLSASGFTTKDITSHVSTLCRNYLSEEINKF